MYVSYPLVLTSLNHRVSVCLMTQSGVGVRAAVPINYKVEYMTMQVGM